MKIKLALLLATLLFFNIILPVRVHAAVIPDISQVTAVWDSNIDTSWDHVYLEYKSLDPQSRYEADKVIAANAYRFLISIGSKPLEGLNQQKFDDFLRAVSPFNIAYNNILAEQVVHAAWTISGEQYKVFCANVIHNIASNPEYYTTHVIKNDSFVNSSGQQSLQVQYNDIDLNEEINIYNNIFNGNILSSSSGSIGVWFNPTPLYYNGRNITYNELLSFLSVKPDDCIFTPFVYAFVYNNTSTQPTLYCPRNGRNYYSFPGGNYFRLRAYINSSNNCTLVTDDYYQSSGIIRYSFYMSNYEVPTYNTESTSYGNSAFLNSLRSINFTYLDQSDLVRKATDFFSNFISDYCVYAEGIKLRVEYSNGSVVFLNVPFPSSTQFISPQFQPVNIYQNNYYGSDDNTYFHVDQMVDNIINNDYSTVNNGSNNIFYNDNYYITQPASGGGIELVTSSSIVYNYITIINNGGGNTSGGSIGSYPYPFDVRIINPEDIKNETEVNTQNDIINNYDFDINAGNLTNTITTVKNTAVNNLNEVAPTTGSSIAWIPFMFSAIPPDLMKIILSFLIVAVLVCVYHSK